MGKLKQQVDEITKILTEQNDSLEIRINKYKEELNTFKEFDTITNEKNERMMNLEKAIPLLEKKLAAEQEEFAEKSEKKKEKERKELIKRLSIEEFEKVYENCYDKNVDPKIILDTFKKSNFRSEFIKCVLDDIKTRYAEEHDNLLISALDIDEQYNRNLNFIIQKYKFDEQKEPILKPYKKSSIPLGWKLYGILKGIEKVNKWLK